MRYFQAQNPARKPCDIDWDGIGTFGGLAFGVYATKDEEELRRLSGAVSFPSNGVTELTKSEYDRSKKKTTTPEPLPPEHLKEDLQLVSAFNGALKGKGNAVVVSGEQPVVMPEQVEKNLSLAEILKLETV